MAISPQKISGAGGTTVSFGNAPQAANDAYTFTEAVEGSVQYLNVMSNDLGGSAKTLWSIDDGNSTAVSGLKTYAPQDLLTQDNVGVVEFSELGAKISITADGQIKYDTSSLGDLDYLPRVNTSPTRSLMPLSLAMALLAGRRRPLRSTARTTPS